MQRRGLNASCLGARPIGEGYCHGTLPGTPPTVVIVRHGLSLESEECKTWKHADVKLTWDIGSEEAKEA